jgi:LacI family transcriptional regulator
MGRRKMDKQPTTLRDIAKALGTSIGSVHRALHDSPGVSPLTKDRVLQMARNLGYRPNLAARYLSSKKTLRISVNTLQGTTSFWDEVRTGIREAAASILLENVEIKFRTYPRLGEGDEEALEAAVRDQVDGIITFPSRPQVLRSWIRRASRARIPVVCVATDAPHSGRLGMVSIDTLASGSIAADLMGRFLGTQEGSVAITLFDMTITEHAEKYAAFESTLRSLYPRLQLLKPIEDHDVEMEAYHKCRKLFERCPDLAGVYVTTEASIPVLNAARDANMLHRLTLITTDLFPDLVPMIRSGAVAATIYQRPRAQGQIAFRMLHEFLVEGANRSNQVALAPHLVMRGNLDFFLQRQSQELFKEKADGRQETTRDLAARFA